MRRITGLTATAFCAAALAPAAASATVAAGPDSLVFSEAKVGTESPAQDVTVIVSCTQFVPMSTDCMVNDTFTKNPTFQGANPGDFSQTNNCAATVSNNGPAPGFCTFNIRFKPTGPGPRKATLILGSSTSGSGPPPITMTGSAVGDPIVGGKKKCKKKGKKGAAAAKKKKCKKKKKGGR
jgi:hypothetical protein